MNASAAIADSEIRTYCGTLSSRQDHEIALDLASAVATHLDAVGTASRQAGSPLGRSTYCFKYASLLHSSARLSRVATARFLDEPS